MDFTNTLMEAMNMELVFADRSMVKVAMPVSDANRQPMGFLHGGANVALAETAASIGAALQINTDTHHVFGLEINANHIKSVRSGSVMAVAKPIHSGRSTVIWEINIYNNKDELVCVSRCTMSIVPKNA